MIAVTAMGILLPLGSLLAEPRPAAPAHGDAEADAEAKLKEKAKAHKNAGNALFNKGEYRDALEEYRKALALRRTGSVLANIAGCLKELGQYDEALDWYEEVLRDFKDPKVLAQVAPSVSELKALMGTLVLEGDTPEGASLFVDDRVRGKLPLSALRLSRGVHKIRVEKRDSSRSRRRWR
jgi:tetratricopeptide (TPR) repeat protein